MDEEKQEEIQEEPKRAKPAEPIMVPVRCVLHRGESALVEWIEEGNYRRGFVPRSAIKDKMVRDVLLAKSIPYGECWEQYIVITATPESIANELRRAGIWTWEDIRADKLIKLNRAFDLGDFMTKKKKEVK